MKHEIQKRVVKIVLPLLNDSSSHFSGYILGNGIIITTRHGFVGNSDYDKTLPIKITAQGGYSSEISLNTGTKFKDLKKNIILFKSKKYDIVLLVDKKAKGQFELFNLNEWDKPGDWEGGGYPSYTQDKYESLDGKIASAVFEGNDLKLKTSQEPIEMSMWSEVSGSPVFLDEQLAGIVRNFDNKLKNRLEATYLKRLWDDKTPKESKFRKLLESTFLTSSKFCKDEVIYHINEYENIKSLLISYLDLNADGKNLSNALFQEDKQEVINFCLQHKHEEHIEKLVMLLMRYHYTCFKISKNTEYGYFDVSYVGDVPCELAMAGEDKSDPQFSIIAEKVQVDAVHRLNFSAESGIFSSAAIDTAKEIINSTASLSLVEERLSQDHPYHGNEIEKFEGSELKEAAEYVLDKSKRSYYWKLKVEKRHYAALAKVATEFPKIKILNTPKNRVSVSSEEIDVFENFRHFVNE